MQSGLPVSQSARRASAAPQPQRCELGQASYAGERLLGQLHSLQRQLSDVWEELQQVAAVEWKQLSISVLHVKCCNVSAMPCCHTAVRGPTGTPTHLLDAACVGRLAAEAQLAGTQPGGVPPGPRHQMSGCEVIMLQVA